MNKTVMIGVLAASLTLANCASTGITPAIIQSAVTQVQQAAISACGFLPTAATVSGILATLIPGAAAVEQMVSQVAQQICAAVAPLKGRKLGAALAAPTVNGVAVHGRFVR